MPGEGHLPNTASGGRVSVDEMASEAIIKRTTTRKQFLKEARKKIEIIGYEYKPYYMRPKKRHLGKIITVLNSPLRHQVFRRLVAQNVPLEECRKLTMITDKKELKKIHSLRSKKMNYGFLGRKKKKPKSED